MLIPKSILIPNQTIHISGSKSESNRLLILQKFLNSFCINDLSNSEDTMLLQKALSSNNDIIDINHAGTAMRFLTSYFAIQEGKTIILTGSERMRQRPIQPLVDALRHIGAKIEYLENEGFPPLKITGQKITKNFVEIPANISSQFITSLILIATQLENGLEIKLNGKITSRPYLEMTLNLLRSIAPQKNLVEFSNSIIKISPFNKIQLKKNKPTFIVESDWSSASYFYSLAAIGKRKITLKNFKKNSLQGDSILVKIFSEFFGIKTIFTENESIILFPKENFDYPKNIMLDMNDCPDIVQTICVTATALKIPFQITGLATLKIKETDRLLALQNELLKLGAKTKITDNSIHSLEFQEIDNNISIATYNDHRMAMSFTSFALIKELSIENPNVVEKSYPNFWKDFFQIIQPIKS